METRKYSRKPLSALLGLVTASAAFIPSSSFAYENGVFTEAVSNYSTQGGSNLPNAIPNCEGFRTGITANADGFNQAFFALGSPAYYSDNSVYDSDFVDAQLSSNGGDTTNFDKRGNAISYYCGHGEDQSTTCFETNCTTSAGCPSAASLNAQGGWKASWTEPRSCVTPRAPTIHRCCYRGPRALYTSSSTSKFGNRIDYSLNGAVKWGESATSGAWAGAGTNGGAKLVILDISHGAVPGVTASHLQNMFAGMWMVMTIMPVAGDTANVANRGSTLAMQYKVNANSNPSASWIGTMNTLPSGGINGDGCYVAFGMDNSAYWVDQHVTQKRWIDYTNDNFDSLGNSYFSIRWACNYDAAANPPSN